MMKTIYYSLPNICTPKDFQAGLKIFTLKTPFYQVNTVLLIIKGSQSW
jgi:hypothetical protein